MPLKSAGKLKCEGIVNYTANKKRHNLVEKWPENTQSKGTRF